MWLRAGVESPDMDARMAWTHSAVNVIGDSL